MRPLTLSLVLAFGALGCTTRSAEPPSPPADSRVRELADAYVAAYLDQFPEQATFYGIPGRSHDRLTDISLAALRAWQRREDRWLADVRAVDPTAIQARPLRATYAIMREALESSVASRVCHFELWPVSQINGWQVYYGYLLTIQPVGNDQARREALARWGTLPKHIDAEIANLREGLRQGYSVPRQIVQIVIESVKTLADAPISSSPLMAPADSDKTPEFTQAFTTLARDQLIPAARRYVEFLEREYLPQARTTIAVSANPNGAACYDASVRAFSTLPKTAKEIHDTGLSEVARIDAAMKTIAETTFGTSDVPALMQRLRTDRRYTFRNRDELIKYSQNALTRARAAAPQWFGILPKADVRIEPYPAFRERSGSTGEYNAPAEDGSRGGLFYISAYQPERTTRAENEATAFHETVPGHHLQIAIALEKKDIHPIGRYFGNSGFSEGWGLYAEELADEMKLFSGELDRLGMLSLRNWRAVRLVVDSGLHVFGWTRQQAIDYMMAHTTVNANDAASEIDRYIIWPGQATAYMLGRLEILAARQEAQQAGGAGFDIKAFHDRVLEDGSVPLTYLREKTRAAFARGPS